MKQEKYPCVYIMWSDRNGTLYVWVTSNPIGRVFHHKNGTFEGFTSKYWVINLLYYEFHETMEEAILREKQIKRWKRDWKIRLIESLNTQWEDKYSELL
jgi:putative endonuclease